MTDYSYECPVHGEFLKAMPFGLAAKGVYHQLECDPKETRCTQWAPRVYGHSSMQFTYGKESFHGPTIGEQIEANRKEWDSAGIKAEPVGERWV